MTEPDRDRVVADAYGRLTEPVRPDHDPLTAVRARIRQRSGRRRAAKVMLAAGVLAAVGVGGVQGLHQLDRDGGAGASAGGQVAAAPRGAVPDAGSGSCAVDYDRETLAGQSWAADATITDLGLGIGSNEVTVSLTVNRWYRGGPGQTLNVRLPKVGAENGPPPYEVGTRLLLSGQTSDGVRLATICGFTRYYDDETAAVWSRVFAR